VKLLLTPLIDAWNRLVRAVLGDANLRSEPVQPGLDVGTSTPQEGAARVAGHRKEWKARLESVGMRPIN